MDAATLPMKLISTFFFAALLSPLGFAQNSLSLSGDWHFQLDAADAGVKEKWHGRTLPETVVLPGTTDTNQKGEQLSERPTDRLVRVWSWKGPAWYQREVTIPEAWAGKRVTLFFERTKNSRVWVDGAFVGHRDSLSAPHEFDVTAAMKPGKHTITVRIDNAKLPPVGPSHQVDERTQTNWNGILGLMELRATDPVWIEDVQAYPDIAAKSAKLKLIIGNTTGQPVEAKLGFMAESCNTQTPRKFGTHGTHTILKERTNVVEFTYPLGADVPLWDEFRPTLIRLMSKLEAAGSPGGTSFAHSHSTRFGMRQFTRSGSQLLINGRPAFLRGRLDCANYPLTGYAPMSLDEWRRIFRITKEWGLNHCRFHSWCPPAAAFEAADELGVYLQVELPNKRSAFNAPDNKDAAHHNIDFIEGEHMDQSISLYDYGLREGEAIFRHYGNSPSFVMFTLGNELGRTEGMLEIVSRFKSIEPRMLHAQGSNNMHWAPSLAEGDDFWVTGKVEKKTKPLRGSFSFFDFPDPHIETYPPSTTVDFRKSIEGVPVPLIGHETGQFQVYPDFRDIPKFTGVLRARNYEIFRERLEKSGMLDQAQDFVRASGALAAICYREDIEAALRTPGFGGFQLLDIMDFPGQGTALVGMLNVFMESKGVIEEARWREFCAEVVPLIRMGKYTWTTAETLQGVIQIAHYGPDDFKGAVVKAELADASGKSQASFSFPAKDLAAGGLRGVGLYQIDLSTLGIDSARQLMLSLSIEGSPYRNRYPIWVYPPAVDTTVPAGVMVATALHAKGTQDHLAAGGKVLLLPKLDQLPRSELGGFQNEFWSPMFTEAAKKRGEKRLPPGTLGLLCDPKHPALEGFPTEFHSNWQWWHLVKNSRPISYDGSPQEFRPLVQAIDNFVRNQKLGLLAETKVGKGSVLICSIDLMAHQDKPEARQMLHSLLHYIGSPAFAPKHELAPDLLRTILPE